MENFNIKMLIDMKVSGLMTKEKAKVDCTLKMMGFLKEYSKMMKYIQAN